MRRRVLVLGVWAVLFFCLSISAIVVAQSVPQLVNYQGRITDGSGGPIAGPVEMRFRLLDSDTLSATVLWSETVSSVEVNNGIYNVLLGSVKPLPPSALSQAEVYLEVRVAGEVLRPRSQLASVAFAHKAASVPDDSITSAMISDGTVTGSDIDSQTITGSNIANETITSTQIQDNSITGADIGDDELGQTQIQDIYVLNTGDTVTGDLQCTADLTVDGSLEVGTIAPSNRLEVVPPFTIDPSLTIDQQQGSTIFWSQEAYDWQSFTAGASGFLRRIDMNLAGIGDMGCYDKTIYVYQGEGTGGTLLHTKVVTVPADGWYSFFPDIDIEISSGSQYTVGVWAMGCGMSVAGWTGDFGNPYPAGISSYLADFDFAFRTYINAFDPNTSPAIVMKNYGPIGIGTNTPVTELEVNGTVTANAFVGDGSGLAGLPDDSDWSFNASDIYYNGGNVGVGTTSPDVALHVEGEAKSVVGGQEFYMVPKGGIIMWSGLVADIPAGWHLCDGNSGTPDLRDRFILGTAAGQEPGETGGAAGHEITLDMINMPTHTHSFTTNAGGSHQHTFNYLVADIDVADFWIGGVVPTPLVWNIHYEWASPTHTGEPQTAFAGSHTHTGTTGISGASVPIDIRPAYYRLAFIMRM